MLRRGRGGISPDSMPLQRIDLSTARSPEVRTRIADAIHRALVDTIAVPKDDRFQVVTAHAAGELVFPQSYLGIPHQDPVLVQVTLSRGRTTEQKQALYRRMGELVQEAGVSPNELVVSLVEAGREDWSFGNGIAQYVPER
jgi:4-oxalocrotonate tautomerase